MIVSKSPEEKPIPPKKCDRCGSQIRYGKDKRCICMRKVCPECGGIDDDHDDDCEVEQ